MGRPRKEPDVFEPIDAVRELQEFEVGTFFDEVSPTVSIVHFHRMYPDGRRPQIGKAPLELIREDVYEYVRTTFVPKYGGGKYLLIARGDGSKFLGSRMIEVEGDVATPQTNGNGSGGHIAQPEEKLPFHDRLLLYQMMRQPAPAIDMGQMMMGLAAIMTAMKPSEPGKPADPIEMFRTVMTMYEGLKGKNERDPLKELREVAAVIKEFTPEGGGKEADTMWGAVASIGKDFIDKGSTVLSQFAARPAVAPGATAVQPPVRFVPGPRGPITAGPAAPGVPALPAGLPEGTVMAGGPVAPGVAPVSPAPVPAVVSVPDQGQVPPAPASAEDNLRRWLTIQVGVLKQKARAGKDPGDWVDYHFENDEEPGVQAVFYAIRQGATFENLISFDPEIGQDVQLSGWFRALYEGIRNGRWVDGEFLPGLLSNPVDTRGPGGYPRDHSADATVGARGPEPAGNSGTGGALPDTDVH